MQTDFPCANPNCKCRVAEQGAFCDEKCDSRASKPQAQSTDRFGDHCECQHGDCGTSTPGTMGNPDQATSSGDPAL